LVLFPDEAIYGRVAVEQYVRVVAVVLDDVKRGTAF
jgi:hypothetical protein